MEYPQVAEDVRRGIADLDSANQHMSELEEIAVTARRPPPVFVPTGVYIQSLEFLSASTARITGTVWQTYVDRYRPLIIDYIRRCGANAQDAEDIAQQALGADRAL